MALALTACVGTPKMDASPVMKDAQDYQSAQSLAAATTQWPEQNWWMAYGDTQLNQLIEEALKDSPDIQKAQGRLISAEGLAQQVGASLYPTLDANASVSGVKQSYNNGVPPAFVPKGIQDTGRATLDFNYEFDFWGKNRASLAAATSQLEATRIDMDQAKLVLSTSIADAYADLAKLYNDLDSANEALKVRQRTVALVKEREENGLENIGRFHQADSLRAAAEAEVEGLNESISLTKNRLAALMGAGPDRGLAIARPAIGKLQPFGLPENLPVNLIGRRPDIVAARMRVESLSKRIEQAKADFYPNINLSAYAGVQSLGLDMLTKSGSSITGFGPAISLPIFDGNNRKGTFRIARGQYDEAIANYNAAVTKGLQDVADVAVSTKELGLRTAKIKEALDASEKAYEVANNRYKGGLATYIDVLTVEDTLINNRRIYADIRSRAFTLDVALARALGGGFSENTTGNK